MSVDSNIAGNGESYEGRGIVMNAQEVVERIMTAHWDMTACRCWICEAGRCLGFQCRDDYLLHKHGNREKYPDPADMEAMQRAIEMAIEAKQKV